MLHKTKGLVLRAVKYGETSLIVSIYTEMFGVQSYIINGVRTSSVKQPYRANLFQPATLLDLIVYHNDRGNLQRIKEFKWCVIYNDIYRNVHKNTVALFMTEVLQKCLTQPEANPDLYAFVEDIFIHLDKGDAATTANFPLYFLANLGQFFGFSIQDTFTADNSFLDLQEGGFVSLRPAHQNYVEGP
jgi:DNA repair protein RecO (recombination protein O)